jgi:hypothetical protein
VAAPAVAVSVATEQAVTGSDDELILPSRYSLYHSRFCHQGVEKTRAVSNLYKLKIHIKQKALKRLCRHCLNGSGRRTRIHTKNASTRSYKPATRFGERLHVDLSAPVTAKQVNKRRYRIPTTGGNIYALVIIDEYTSYTWLYLLPYKSCAANRIKELVLLLAASEGVAVGEIHSDGGTEFINKELETLSHTSGFRLTYTTTDTPQHNSYAERQIGKVFAGIRSVLSESGAPLGLWGEAALFVVYVLNRTPLNKLGGKTPYHKAREREPDISKIRVFGCDVSVRRPGHQHSTLDMLFADGIYLGVNEAQNAYNILVPGTRTYVVSRDVRFNESSFTLIRKYHTEHSPVSSRYLFNAGPGEHEQELTLVTAPAVQPDTVPVSMGNVEDTSGDTELTNNVSDPEANDDSFGPPQVVTEGTAHEYHDESNPNDHGYVDPPEYHTSESEDEADSALTSSSSSSDFSPYPTGTVADTGAHNVRTSTDIISYPNDTSVQVHLPTVPPPVVTRSGRTVKAVKQYGRPDEGDYLMSMEVIPFTHASLSSDMRLQSLKVIGKLEGKLAVADPATYSQAMKRGDAPEWRRALLEEMRSLRDNGAWVLVPPPSKDQRATIMRGKWVFKTKCDANGRVVRYKCRFVCKGFMQIYGVDYFDTYAPVAAFKSIKLILCIAAIRDLECKQYDVETAFLNAEMDVPVYVHQPEGFVDKEHPHHVCLLKRALYGLKQAPLLWYEELYSTMVAIGYTRSIVDLCIFYKIGTIKLPSGNTQSSTTVSIFILVSVYVDDIVVAYSRDSKDQWLHDVDELANKYKMKDLGDINWILNMAVTRDRTKRSITLSQEPYINSMLDKFKMTQCKPAKTPTLQKDLNLPLDGTEAVQLALEGPEHEQYRSIIGSLMYAANATRIDIAFTVGALARHLAKPFRHHYTAAMHVLRYLAGTKTYCMQFKPDGVSGVSGDLTSDKVLLGYSDANWANDIAKRKSTTGAIVMYHGNPISWVSKMQDCVAQSTAEAEYIALSVCVKEILWYRKWLHDVLGEDVCDIPTMVDNQPAISIASNTSASSPVTKHISIRYNFVKEEVRVGTIALHYCSTQHQLADILTKGLDTTLHQSFTKQLLLSTAPSVTNIGKSSAPALSNYTVTFDNQWEHQSGHCSNYRQCNHEQQNGKCK